MDNEPIPARCPHRLPPEADGDRVLVDANVKSSSSPPPHPSTFGRRMWPFLPFSPASFYHWSKDVPRMGICPSFGRPHPSPARRKGPCQRGGSRLPSRLPRPFPAQPLLKLSFRRAGNENSRSLSRPAAFPSFAEEGGATQISCFISLRKRISFVDVPDDIFSAILTALNIVRCFPFQNAFSDTVRFFERKTHRG